MNVLDVGRCAYGVALLVAPDATVELLTRRPDDVLARRFARLLGARLVAQSVAVGRLSSRWAYVGAAIDATHAISALALARANAAHRRMLHVNAAIAAGFAAEGLVRALPGG